MENNNFVFDINRYSKTIFGAEIIMSEFFSKLILNQTINVITSYDLYNSNINNNADFDILARLRAGFTKEHYVELKKSLITGTIVKFVGKVIYRNLVTAIYWDNKRNVYHRLIRLGLLPIFFPTMFKYTYNSKLVYSTILTKIFLKLIKRNQWKNIEPEIRNES
jgi:hypothetical protein